MNRVAVVVTKALIVVLFAALLASQAWIVPAVALGIADAYPEYARLLVPGVLLAGLLVLCVEIVLVCVWRLLSMVREDSIFRESAFGWVNTILASVVIATVLLVIGMVVISTAQAGSPVIAISGAMGIVFGTGLALVITVLRSLLRKASELEHELSEVV